MDDELSLRLKGYSLVTLNILYYMPDHRNIVQEFTWQTLDLNPKYPRIERFLNHWKNEIDAVIKEIQLCDSNNNFNPSRFENITQVFKI